MKLLPLLLLFTSCAWTNFHQRLAEKQISRVEQEFIQVANKNKVKPHRVKYNFANLKELFPKSNSWAGVCAKNNQIYFDIRWWNNSHSLDKEQVILHELGHCALGLKHGSGLMSQEPIPESFYLKNKQTLIQQLFDKYKLK